MIYVITYIKSEILCHLYISLWSTFLIRISKKLNNWPRTNRIILNFLLKEFLELGGDNLIAEWAVKTCTRSNLKIQCQFRFQETILLLFFFAYIFFVLQKIITRQILLKCQKVLVKRLFYIHSIKLFTFFYINSSTYSIILSLNFPNY